MRGSRQAVATLMRGLDAASEAAEVVDCFFKALPQRDRRRWSKGRDRQFEDKVPERFSLEGANWKAQAVWYNFHKVDHEKAMECVYKNHLEDQVLGRLYGSRSDILTGKARRSLK